MPRVWYNSYAEALAWEGGFVVVQYETSSDLVKPLIPDDVEVEGWACCSAKKKKGKKGQVLVVPMHMGMNREVDLLCPEISTSYPTI